MKTTSLVLASLLIGTLFAETKFGIEVVGNTWENGIAEVDLRSGYPIQSSGSAGETIIKARCEGLLQKVTGTDGNLTDILRNSSGTMIGFNFKPATEVNQIYLVVKANNDQVRIFENLSLILIPELAPIQQGFTKGRSGLLLLDAYRR